MCKNKLPIATIELGLSDMTKKYIVCIIYIYICITVYTVRLLNCQRNSSVALKKKKTLKPGFDYIFI